MRMLLAYVLIFVLHLSASTCDATSRNLLAGHAADNDKATALHHHTASKADVFSDYTGVRHYRQHDHPVMMARPLSTMEPSPSPSPMPSPPALSSDASATEQEASAASDDHRHHTTKADVFTDYTGVRHYHHQPSDDKVFTDYTGVRHYHHQPSDDEVFTDYTGVRHYHHQPSDDDGAEGTRGHNRGA